jgi:ribonuclease HII
MPDFSLENLHGREAGTLICGVDEAGRGPLAGPVVAAAVIWPANITDDALTHIRDSKKMTAAQRDAAFELITSTCVYAIAEASVQEIDTINILQASMLAMRRAVEGVGDMLKGGRTIPLPLAGGVRGGLATKAPMSKSPPPSPEFTPAKAGASGRGAAPFPPQSTPTYFIHLALIDGNRCPTLPCKAIPIIKGDDKSLSIAAASILAKVTRDRMMEKLASEYPGYGWERNMGYGTKQHMQALQELGLTPWHRTSFAPVQLRKIAG